MNQEIIKLAIQGGYKTDHYHEEYGFAGDTNRLLLDKEFWIALGKQLGWGIYIYKNGEMLPNTWLYYAHQFLDARFEGREQEFFKELIEKR